MAEVLVVTDPNGQNSDRKALVARRLAEVETMLAIVNSDVVGKDVPVKNSRSAAELMAAVVASGGVGTK